MPLTKDPNVGRQSCACGKWFDDKTGWFAHLGDCPILRCRYCLQVLRNDHPFSAQCATPENHRCPPVPVGMLP